MRLRSAIIVWALTLLSVVSLSLAETSSDDQGKYMLWSIKTPSNTVYLLGSVHVMQKKYYPLPLEIEYTYRKCRHIAFETQVDEKNLAEVAASKIIEATLPAGKTLSDRISKETLKALKKVLRRNNIALEDIDHFQPWFVAEYLSALELQNHGFLPELGIDWHFIKKATRDDKQKYFLESVEFQLKLLAGLHKQNQEEMLQTSLKQIESMGTMLHVMAKAWKEGNTNVLERVFLEDMQKYPELYDKIMVQRNKDWVPKIESLLKKKHDFFVVVGCGHLIGPDSLITMLRKRGHKVTRH